MGTLIDGKVIDDRLVGPQREAHVEDKPTYPTVADRELVGTRKWDMELNRPSTDKPLFKIGAKSVFGSAAKDSVNGKCNMLNRIRKEFCESEMRKIDGKSDHFSRISLPTFKNPKHKRDVEKLMKNYEASKSGM